MDNKIQLVSVVRDFDMYKRCISENPYCQGFTLVTIDNSLENKSISVRYNQFLDQFQGEGWIIFAHEDWKLLEDICPLLEKAETNRIYGPIGSWTKECKNADFIVTKGRILQGSKDNVRTKRIKCGPQGGQVDTFDCQCLIVHSSLIRKYELRFDENLSFDLYVEDFCIHAYEEFSIESWILTLRCIHFSQGNITPRFYDSLAYLRAKYKQSKKRYSSTAGRLTTIGKNVDKPVFNLTRHLGTIIRYLIKK